MEMRLLIASDGYQLTLEGDAPVEIDRQMKQIVTSRAELLGMLLMYEGRKLMKLTDQELRDRTLAAELGA
jgi:hypothetical protein